MNDQQAETVIKLLKKVRDRMLGVGVLLVAILACLIAIPFNEGGEKWT